MAAMPTQIKTGTSLVTLVNVFETTPETQQRLLELLTIATDEEIAKQPGFVSANLHTSRDGLRVVNYAQWESVEALQAMLSDPACRVHIDEAEKIAKPDVHLYDVVCTAAAP
jgi:quinol monooxygenase YgiN